MEVDGKDYSAEITAEAQATLKAAHQAAAKGDLKASTKQFVEAAGGFLLAGAPKACLDLTPTIQKNSAELEKQGHLAEAAEGYASIGLAHKTCSEVDDETLAELKAQGQVFEADAALGLSSYKKAAELYAKQAKALEEKKSMVQAVKDYNNAAGCFEAIEDEASTKKFLTKVVELAASILPELEAKKKIEASMEIDMLHEMAKDKLAGNF